MRSILSSHYLQTGRDLQNNDDSASMCVLVNTRQSFRQANTCCGSFEIKPECFSRISCKDHTASFDSLLHRIQIQVRINISVSIKHINQKHGVGMSLACIDLLPWTGPRHTHKKTLVTWLLLTHSLLRCQDVIKNAEPIVTRGWMAVSILWFLIGQGHFYDFWFDRGELIMFGSNQIFCNILGVLLFWEQACRFY